MIDNLDEMKQKYLETNKVRMIGRPPKRDTFKTNDILTIYTKGQIERVL